MIGIIAGLIFLFLALGAAGVVLVTAWWLWKRAALAEGERAPKWGDLSSLMAVFRGRLLAARMLTAALIAALMTIPLGFIYDLTVERHDRYNGIAAEISSSWGTSQIFAGPALSVPYTVRYQITEDVPLSAAELAYEQSRGGNRTTREVVRNIEEQYTAFVLPDDLYVEGNVTTETRSRSIYSVRVYTADLKVRGSFTKPDITGLRQHVSEVHWDKVTFAVGITSTKAIRSISALRLGGREHGFLPGTGGMKLIPTGFSLQADLSDSGDKKSWDFDFEVSVGGSNSLYMTPVGVSNTLKLTSDWPHPNFTGSGLPSSRTVTASGFTSEWDIPNLVRNYPQAGDSEEWLAADSRDGMYDFEGRTGHNIKEYIAGVEFFEPVFYYSLLSRAVKYGILFVSLMFLGVVIFDSCCAKGGYVMNFIQYAVIGVGLAAFYLTLLALSEHIGFTAAYTAASVLNIAMIGGYVAAASGRKVSALLTALTQALLYAMLFFILRMEDYALLAGTALFVASTAALMTVTRNANRAGAD
jgi:inner membrane protein